MTGNGYRDPRGIDWPVVGAIVASLVVMVLICASPRHAVERERPAPTVIAGGGHNASYAQ